LCYFVMDFVSLCVKKEFNHEGSQMFHKGSRRFMNGEALNEVN
jgi:hypothetical protein